MDTNTEKKLAHVLSRAINIAAGRYNVTLVYKGGDFTEHMFDSKASADKFVLDHEALIIDDEEDDSE